MITLKSVIDLLIKENLLRELIIENDWHYQVPEEFLEEKFLKLTYDSRQAEANTLFICKGINFKADYLHSALNNGVTSYMSELVYESDAKFAIIVKNIQKAMAVVARAFYNYPDQELFKIGITGTKGKTTSAYMIKNILAKHTNNKVALFSTAVNIVDGVTENESNLTTPESLDLFRMMREAVDYGMKYLVMEVSSQAYKLNRVYGVDYDLGVFLNISPDHISNIEHPTFDDYFNCKLELFNNCKKLIINKNSDYYVYMTEKINAKNLPYITYGDFESNAEYTYTPGVGTKFEIKDKNDFFENFEIMIPGEFNQSNATLAVVISLLLNIPISDIKEGLLETIVPGRMEKVQTEKNKNVYIDYAHNYLSLKECLSFLHKVYKGKVIAVTGSIGGKAKNRRKDLGVALSEEADIAIITSEDSMFEDPYQIMHEIEENITNPNTEVYEIFDRKEAIQKAIDLASEDDVILIAGKGREAFLKVNGETLEYPGDYMVAQEYMK